MPIEEVLTSSDRVHGFQGLAGTGKTSSLNAIREGAERNGYAVQGFAPTSKAASQLRQDGISADTLQSFLARGGQAQMSGDPASRHLYMLDESSLASTRQMKDFLDKIGPQDRVLVIGDTRQHREWTPANHSSKCRTPGCEQPDSSKSFASRTRNS